MSSTPLDDLRREIAEGRALVLVGAGVSVAATRNAPAASWTGLIKDGVERCAALDPSLSKWKTRRLNDIADGDLDELLGVAEQVASKLGAPAGGEYKSWLRETVGALRTQDRAVLEALRDLGIPLATTNYDDLLEEATGLRPVTWRDGAEVERVVRDEDRAILHLHGHWRDPESVVLGIRSYARVMGDTHAQTVLAALRMTRTLLFVGFGAGLGDPNFGTFLRWTRKVFAECEARQYRLCRESERETIQTQHPPEERILALSYRKHADLASFLRSLTPRKTRRAVPGSTQPPGAARFPVSPRCFGRDDELRELVAALLADSPPPVPILGPAGAGKSTITLVALHERRVAERFGARRFFVRCEGAKSREAMAAEIARAFAIEPGPHIELAVFAELERAPAAIVLDNLETPWEAETAAVEAFLGDLCGVSGVALCASIRGEQRPFGIPWREAIRVGPLSPEAARRAFLAVAGQQFDADLQLDLLIEAVDRLALAVTLLAHQAEGEPDLGGLWKRWQERRTGMLRAGSGNQRLTNLGLSLELSIASPRMTESARRLLSILALLPDGIAHQDLVALMAEEAGDAASILRRVGLALDQAERLRTLAPVREHAHRHLLLAVEDRNRAVAHYTELAKLGEQVGRENGAIAVERLTPEVGNLEAMTLAGLETKDPRTALEATISLTKLARFTGLVAATSLRERALRAATRIADPLVEARCVERFGDLALYRSDLDTARDLSQRALQLFRGIGDILGEANCIRRFGDIAFGAADDSTARQHYEEALPLYQRIGSVRGEADCIRSLGDLALEYSEPSTARRHYQTALSLFQRLGDALGQANCIGSLADVALLRLEHEDACRFYKEALPLFQRVGSARGEANCIKSLGDIALRASDHDTARDLYQQALPLYRRVGSILGEASCMQSLGDLALLAGERGAAYLQFEEALALYRRVEDLYSISWALVRLARLTPDENQKRVLVQEAKAAWEGVNRPDLVEDLLAEFGDLAG